MNSLLNSYFDSTPPPLNLGVLGVSSRLGGAYKRKILSGNESARADVKQLVLELAGRRADGFCPLEVIDHG